MTNPVKSLGLPRRMTFGTMIPQKTLARLTLCVPVIDRKTCVCCMECRQACPAGAISKGLAINRRICIRCGACAETCGSSAIELKFTSFIPPLYISLHVHQKHRARFYFGKGD